MLTLPILKPNGRHRLLAEVVASYGGARANDDAMEVQTETFRDDG
jgi:hypothetical protein